MNSEQGTIQQFRDTNPVFITWSVSQGTFKKAHIPKELRHILIEYASREYVASRQKVVREMFMINLSLQDILFLSEDCLHGIKILNDAKASKRYDLSCNASRISYTIKKEDYDKTLIVPPLIKLKVLEGNTEKNIPEYDTVFARIIMHPSLIEHGGVAYETHALTHRPALST